MTKKQPHLTHDALRQHLSAQPGHLFVRQLTLLERPTIPHSVQYEVYDEVTIHHDEHLRRMDEVILLSTSDGHGTISIGVEIKGHRRDLNHDDKMWDYLGHTDYFFLAVPHHILYMAKPIASHNSNMGVMCLDTGEIIIKPKFQRVSKKNRTDINQSIKKKAPVPTIIVPIF